VSPCIVSLASCPDYDPDRVQAAVDRVVEPLGGMAALVQPGQRVLLKPNLLAPKPAASAVNTHPQVVAAVARRVLQAGARPVIGDSPGLGSARKNAGRCGLLAEAKALGVPVLEFADSVAVGKTRQEGFPLELAREVLEADAVINLPKLKTHSQLLMTLGVKNLFGCVVGKRKIQWHLKAGVDREAFARMIVEIYAAVRPVLTLVDGIVGMEGDGPGSGRPVRLGMVAASRDAVALDAVLMDRLGMDPERLPTLRAARRLGIGTADPSAVTLAGEVPPRPGRPRIRLPRSADLEWRLPGFLLKRLKDALSATPQPQPDLCRLCGVCQEACPEQVISVRDQKLVIDTRRCIRCFCCQELCPQQAVTIYHPWLGRLILRAREARQDEGAGFDQFLTNF